MVNSKTTGDANPWADIVGPCYISASLARALGWTDAAVIEAADSLTLLKLTTDDGVELYPAFQIQDGQPAKGLAEVLRALSSGTHSSWAWAQWLNATITDEDGMAQPTNIQRLREGKLLDVLRDAELVAAVWRG